MADLAHGLQCSPYLCAQLGGGVLAEFGLDGHVHNGQRAGEAQLGGGAADSGNGRGERCVVIRGERPLLADREGARDREFGRGDGLGIDSAAGREGIVDQADLTRWGRLGACAGHPHQGVDRVGLDVAGRAVADPVGRGQGPRGGRVVDPQLCDPLVIDLRYEDPVGGLRADQVQRGSPGVAGIVGKLEQRQRARADPA